MYLNLHIYAAGAVATWWKMPTCRQECLWGGHFEQNTNMNEEINMKTMVQSIKTLRFWRWPKTMLSTRRELYENLKRNEVWRNWRWCFARKYWSSIEVFHSRINPTHRIFSYGLMPPLIVEVHRRVKPSRAPLPWRGRERKAHWPREKWFWLWDVFSFLKSGTAKRILGSKMTQSNNQNKHLISGSSYDLI